MKLAEEIRLIDADGFAESGECMAALHEIRSAIERVYWPPGSDRFIINPTVHGSGVLPIRTAFVLALTEYGWRSEVKFPLDAGAVDDAAGFGPMDASKPVDGLPFVVEWETGNISSSHRAMNKMALGLIEGAVSGGILVVPTTAFARFLTDRVGNIRELRPYFRLWGSLAVRRGFLGIFVVEHNDEDPGVPTITKGTDGRALR